MRARTSTRTAARRTGSAPAARTGRPSRRRSLLASTARSRARCRGGRRAELRDDLSRLSGRDHPRAQPVPALQLGAALEHARSLLFLREEEVAALAEPDVDAELLGEPPHEGDRLLRQLDQGRRPPRGTHAAAVATGGALAEVAALEDEDLLRAAGGQVPGEGEPHDPAADDRDVD